MARANRGTVMIRRYCFALLLVLVYPVVDAQADDSCQVQDKTDGYQSLRFVLRDIVNLSEDNCYGRSKDPKLWVVELNTLLGKTTSGDIKSIRPKILAAFKQIQAQLELENSTVPHADDLRRALIRLVNLPALTDQSLLPGGLRGNDWKFDTRKNSITIGNKDNPIELKPLLVNECSSEPVDWSQCEPAVRKVEMLLTYWGATSKTVFKYIKPFGNQALQELELLDKRWEAYYYDARPQNFLEVGFNSWRFNKNNEGEDGFLSPPDYQWIWLHPNIALEYIEDVPDGSKFQESLVIEIFGRNSWTWKKDSSKMERPFGWSVIASITDREDVDKIGWGVMFHINHNYSFAFTDHDGNAGFLLSVDLLRFFGGWTQEARDKFTRFSN